MELKDNITEKKEECMLNNNIIGEEGANKNKFLYHEILPKITANTPRIIDIIWHTSKVLNQINETDETDETEQTEQVESETSTEVLNGYLSVVVSMHSINLTPKDFYKYNKELFSKFIADFLGELVIRHNMKYFFDAIVKQGNYLCNPYVINQKHTHFGLKIDNSNENLIFILHVSLIQRILTENVRQQMVIK